MPLLEPKSAHAVKPNAPQTKPRQQATAASLRLSKSTEAPRLAEHAYFAGFFDLVPDHRGFERLLAWSFPR